MAFQSHNLLLSFIIISFVACSLQEDPLDDMYVGNSPSNVDDGGTSKSLIIKQRPTNNILRLNRFVMLDATSSSSSATKLNVNDYGAKGDGKTDDTQAFKKAWKEACSSGGAVILAVPQNNYLLKPITFSGPCKSQITMQIGGSIEASEDRSEYSEDTQHWVMFESVEKLTVEGGGTINGNGNTWWKNSCKKNPKLVCIDPNQAVTFYKCKNLIVENLTIKNGQQINVNIEESMDVKVSGVTVKAPGDSPNTDGIHITNTKNIKILKTLIATGDDCISIESGTQNLQVSDLTCGPGHGISIGSLGDTGSKESVSGITVNGAKLSGTTKTWQMLCMQGGSGSASNIKFQNIEMDNVANPIIIDQNYCDQKNPCKQKDSGIEIKNVLYENIKGTSASEVGVSLNCSESVPCEGIVLQNVKLQREGDGEASKASCQSVKLSYQGHVSPRCP
ncbi:Polygalacturonase [Senna tora]|uniref:endo-polygalacturonase n=1 Tax=Senna tora TaxID=362788 RepID=A0A834WGZ7_9FABA|nr:Polygalacturonase [Senna tora]